jgi:hypothetical protein
MGTCPEAIKRLAERFHQQADHISARRTTTRPSSASTSSARWDFLAGTFSKEAVLKGEFDRYCDSKKGRGAQPFDDAFLGEIEEWRKGVA